MPDPVFPLPPDERLPSPGTYNAIGATLLHNSGQCLLTMLRCCGSSTGGIGGRSREPAGSKPGRMRRAEGGFREVAASTLPIAYLVAFLAFWVGCAVFAVALAVGGYPDNLDPEPNFVAVTLLHPLALFAGPPVVAGAVAFWAFAVRRRR
ncbi:hypothetical protein ITI46_19070 [Streptomyces oryzae]|uniref:Uncharacterized protein n=1 Tax=Streptomyces oryzae TaxID=1434886 RepID=A0ABS3XED4_9ACTN|nr:hypothetical protein [Streptomyces oryzae]MBO8193745.1 hypothetical protein [Streptomyces oryzae]